MYQFKYHKQTTEKNFELNQILIFLDQLYH